MTRAEADRLKDYEWTNHPLAGESPLFVLRIRAGHVANSEAEFDLTGEQLAAIRAFLGEAVSPV